jgi:hypothetical protein
MNFREFLDSVDIFAVSTPKLNFKGRKLVFSMYGLLCTFLFYAVIILASTPLILRIVTGRNAKITEFKEYNRYNNVNDSLDLEANNFTAAILITKSH